MSLYRRWIIACTTGEVVGIGTATLAAVAVNLLIGEPRSRSMIALTLALFVVVGAIEGAALGFFQWRVLRDQLPRLRMRDWVGITVAVAVLGWIAGMTPSLLHEEAALPQPEPALLRVLLVAAVAGAGAGTCFGAAQWLVLRRHAEHAASWIWIHAPAWAVAMSAIFLGASLPDVHSSTTFIVICGASGGVLGGLALGAITGLVVRHLQSRP